MGIVNCLLDTCTFLWLAQQPGMVSDVAANVIDDPSNGLFMSDSSILEIVMKVSAGKLPLPGQPRVWIAEKLKYHQVETLPLNPDVLFRSGELPRTHADPFDRLIAAQAIESAMTIVSPDRPLSDLGAARIW